MTTYNESDIDALIQLHLGVVLNFDPYANFPGAKSKSDFCRIMDADPAFSFLGLGDDKYVIQRFGGNLITSLHRKIGDMYEDIFQYLIKNKFSIPDSDLNFSVDVEIGERKQRRSTDGIIRIRYLADQSIASLDNSWKQGEGLAFEVRSCYKIGDSKRIQADYDMALALDSLGYTPIMLIFCNTSLVSPVVRLRNSWNLFEGSDTFVFIKELTGFDLLKYLNDNSTKYRSTIQKILTKL